jgi:hypothetical protein
MTPNDTTNPADSLPARTTPTWEIEVLLSGASVFALFQLYDTLQRSFFDLFERLSPTALGLLSALSTYVQAGVLALAIGFLIHLMIRSFWAAAVGLQSIDASGSLGRTGTLGPAQRALLAERWARLPARIAELDDQATMVFALSLGLAKLMAILVLTVLVAMAIGLLIVAASGGRIDLTAALGTVLALTLTPFLVVTVVDSRRGKKNLPPLPWTQRVLAPYAAAGMTADSNLGMQMLVHRMSGGRRSVKGTVAITALVTALMIVVAVVPLVQRVGIGALLKGEFPGLVAGQQHALRAVHYLDRLPVGRTLRAPVIPSEVAKPPYLRLFIPYVPHWHDGLLSDCRKKADATDTWRHDALASAATLRCVAEALPVTLDRQPVNVLWMFADDRRADRRGFVVMIDVRTLDEGRHELVIVQPEAAYDDDEPEEPWRIPFWR